MNEHRLLFIPECYADTAILQFFKIKHLNHASGIHAVAKGMEHQKDDYHKILVGVVDNDKKNTPRYFDDFIEKKSENNSLLKQKPGTNHYLILLCPEFESWILSAAQSVEVDPATYNLPSQPKTLHHITQQINIAKNRDFMDFLKEINKRKAAPLVTLKSWLNNFKQMKIMITLNKFINAGIQNKAFILTII